MLKRQTRADIKNLVSWSSIWDLSLCTLKGHSVKRTSKDLSIEHFAIHFPVFGTGNDTLFPFVYFQAKQNAERCKIKMSYLQNIYKRRSI